MGAKSTLPHRAEGQRRHVRTGWLLCVCLVCAASARSLADTVVLRSGVQLRNVKTSPIGEMHLIEFEDGTIEKIPNSRIRSLRRAATTWTRNQVKEPEAPKVVTPEPSLPASRRSLAPILKSAVLPGWGQISEDRVKTGMAYGAASILVFQRYWTYRQRHAAAQRDYNDPVPVGLVASQSVSGSLTLPQAAAINLAYLSQKEKQVYSLQRKGNNMLALLPAVWAWNMLDIVHGGVPWEKRWLGSAPREQVPVLCISSGPGSITAAVRYYL